MAQQLVNLWPTNKHKFIVVDEGINVTFGEHLIIGLLKIIKEKKIEDPIKILLFSRPKCHLEKYFQLSGVTNFEIQDYFNINMDDKAIDLYEQLTNFVTENSNFIFVIDCLGTLALQIGVAKACRFIEKLSKNYKSEVFCIYRRNFYEVIPRIETLGNVYVKLKKSNRIGSASNVHYEISVIHKKPNGNIIRWNELIQQNIETYNLQSEKILNNSYLKRDVAKPQEPSVKPQSTFRLELSEDEIKQRDSVQLPYIIKNKSEKDCKILYVPDDGDDFDDEDPDDDLDI